jgi:hypothetical protein
VNVVLLLVAGLAAAERDPDGFGVGVLLGIPTGFSVAWRPGGPVWFDAAVGYSFENRSFATHTDVLVTLLDKPPEDGTIHLPVWIGVGPRFRIGDGTRTYNAGLVGLRVPVGFGVWGEGRPVEGWFEVAPGVAVVPEVRVVCDVAVGGRFYLPAASRPEAE